MIVDWKRGAMERCYRIPALLLPLRSTAATRCRFPTRRIHAPVDELDSGSAPSSAEGAVVVYKALRSSVPEVVRFSVHDAARLHTFRSTSATEYGFLTRALVEVSGASSFVVYGLLLCGHGPGAMTEYVCAAISRKLGPE